jgi:hypothetical protein
MPTLFAKLSAVRSHARAIFQPPNAFERIDVDSCDRSEPQNGEEGEQHAFLARKDRKTIRIPYVCHVRPFPAKTAAENRDFSWDKLAIGTFLDICSDSLAKAAES